MSLGQRIKIARKNAKMTQAQLAELLGLSTITIRQYEADKREPRYKTIRMLSKALDCDTSVLVDPKQEAQMIYDQLCGTNQDEMSAEGEEPRGNASSGTLSNSPVQRYINFISENPFLMQLLEKNNIHFEIKEEHGFTSVTHGQDSILVSTDNVISDLELLSRKFNVEIQKFFQEHYAINYRGEED